MAARVFDGARWIPLQQQESELRSGGINESAGSPQQPRWKPMPPQTSSPPGGINNEDIFVSVTSFRDGKRCGSTLHSLFDNAKNPNRVYVGLVEQNDAHDIKCLEEYCKMHGVDIATRRPTETSINEARSKCPHYTQIRYLAVFHLGASGPVVARALQRKNIADEEYCLQVDSQTSFSNGWDDIMLQQWLMTENEYGVISTSPPNVKDRHLYDTGGEQLNQVPRICHSEFNAADLPHFREPPVGYVENLQRPLLAQGWNAGFSFSKCHLETSVPYDYFMSQIFDGEEFPRYARMWTRGYDVYTPTRNVVFHDYGNEPDGHDMKGWPRRDLLRRRAIERIFTILQMKGGDGNEEAQANLGLFGLGRRRSLKQFMEHVGIDLVGRVATNDKGCGDKSWIGYDIMTTSAMDNLFDHADDLDPQPEFPLRGRSNRRQPSSSQQVLTSRRGVGALATPKFDSLPVTTTTTGGGVGGGVGNVGKAPLFAFWIVGVVFWYYYCSGMPTTTTTTGNSSGGVGVKRKKRGGKRSPSSSSSSKRESSAAAAVAEGGGYSSDDKRGPKNV